MQAKGGHGSSLSMKPKCRQIILSLSVVLLLILGVLIMRGIYRHAYYAQGRKWLKFAEDAGFLNSPGVAVGSYAEATEILRHHGIDVQFFEEHHGKEQNSTMSSSAWKEFIRYVIEGAKAKKLGIKIKTPELFTTEIYMPDGKRFEFKNFELLSKTISYLAKVELTHKTDIDKAILLGNVNLALGTQLSAYNVDFIHMSGIACKDLGLDTLDECAKAQNDKDFAALLSEMRKELEKEFEIVRKMPPQTSSFGDFFRQCMKSDANVHEADQ